MYGIQTANAALCFTVRFENDVKMYGIQTRSKEYQAAMEFENDVKMYGIQTVRQYEETTL